MGIEEDIENLKKLNNLFKFFKTYGWIPNLSREINTSGIIEAIDHILAERENDKKKIKNLEEKLLDMLKGTETIKKETPEYIKENYILKQKVEEEIEALRKMFKATMEGKIQEYTPEEILIKRNTLKELLEDK